MYRNLHVSVVLAALVATTVACGESARIPGVTPSDPLATLAPPPPAPAPAPTPNPGGGQGQATALSIDPTLSTIPEGTSKMFTVTGGNPNTEPGFGLRVYGRVAGTTARPMPLAPEYTAHAGRVEKMGSQYRYVSSSSLASTLKTSGWDLDYIEIEVSSSGVTPAYTRVCFKGYICSAPAN